MATNTFVLRASNMLPTLKGRPQKASRNFLKAGKLLLTLHFRIKCHCLLGAFSEPCLLSYLFPSSLVGPASVAPTWRPCSSLHTLPSSSHTSHGTSTINSLGGSWSQLPPHWTAQPFRGAHLTPRHRSLYTINIHYIKTQMGKKMDFI